MTDGQSEAWTPEKNQLLDEIHELLIDEFPKWRPSTMRAFTEMLDGCWDILYNRHEEKERND